MKRRWEYDRSGGTSWGGVRGTSPRTQSWGEGQATLPSTSEGKTGAGTALKVQGPVRVGERCVWVGWWQRTSPTYRSSRTGVPLSRLFLSARLPMGTLAPWVKEEELADGPLRSSATSALLELLRARLPPAAQQVVPARAGVPQLVAVVLVVLVPARRDERRRDRLLAVLGRPVVDARQPLAVHPAHLRGVSGGACQREVSAGCVSVSRRVATAARAEWRRIEGEVVGYLGSVSEVSRHLHLGAVVELGPGRHACVAKQQKSSNGVECGCNTVECSRRVIWSARWDRRQVCSRLACRAGCRRAAPRST